MLIIGTSWINGNFLFKVARILLHLPFVAFFYCLAVIYTSSDGRDFVSASGTHCHVRNFAISVSEAISSPDFSRYLWQGCVLLHIPSRVFFSKKLSEFYISIVQDYATPQKVQFWLGWIYVTSLLSNLEWFSLVGLSFFTSSWIFNLHQAAVCIFLVSYLIHMGMTTNVERSFKKEIYPPDGLLVNIRSLLTFLNFCSVVSVAYFYFRHNMFCEAYVYSFFCLSEYVSIILNMTFHLTTPCILSKGELFSDIDAKENETKPEKSALL